MGQENTLHGTVPAQMGMLNYSGQKVRRQSGPRTIQFCILCSYVGVGPLSVR